MKRLWIIGESKIREVWPDSYDALIGTLFSNLAVLRKKIGSHDFGQSLKGFVA